MESGGSVSYRGLSDLLDGAKIATRLYAAIVSILLKRPPHDEVRVRAQLPDEGSNPSADVVAIESSGMRWIAPRGGLLGR